MGKNELTVCELFAGVGGFHLGLERSGWKVVWANQWEPGKKEQHAANCYRGHFPETPFVNDDIARVKGQVPSHTLLVGGFPCQDYSVATTKAHGITGKKGVLWWEINTILQAKIDEGRTVPYVLLENVDRLVKSPSDQRGRDFGMILACLDRMGYAVEWRVINAADYGFPQKRRRTFIFATRASGPIDELYGGANEAKVVLERGFFAPIFKVRSDGSNRSAIDLPADLQVLSDRFSFDFQNAGYVSNGRIFTIKTTPVFQGDRRTLRDVLVKDAGEEFYVDESMIGDENNPTNLYKKSWRYCKGGKAEYRKDPNGYEYHYTEGPIPFPDRLDEPSRTMLTSDGNKRPNRITHIILDPVSDRYRILTPIEAERLNGFEDGWTEDMPLRWRYFCMGNALVVGLIEIMGKRLASIVSDLDSDDFMVAEPRKTRRRRIDEYR